MGRVLQQWGRAGDIPVSGDYDGDFITERELGVNMPAPSLAGRERGGERGAAEGDGHVRLRF